MHDDVVRWRFCFLFRPAKGDGQVLANIVLVVVTVAVEQWQ